MEDNEIIGELCTFYEIIDEVNNKYVNNEITYKEAIKKINDTLSAYYGDYSKCSCGGYIKIK